MDLNSGYPWWAGRDGLPHALPQLQQDQQCEVLVVGGGISGALIADELSAHGHDVLMIEQRDIGWGSTAASTALLQYEIDTHLLDLARQYGSDAAELAYRACAEAIPALGAVARGLKKVDFQRMDSLYLASRHRDVPVLMAEGAARREAGLDARWLQPDDLQQRFGVDALPGRTGYALEDITDRSGTVRIGGEDWTARPPPAHLTIPHRHAADVIPLDGPTAVVYPPDLPCTPHPR